MFGESAGAGCLSNHLVMTRSWGLFQSVALESGSFSDWVTQPLTVAESTYSALLANVNCSSVACLQGLSTEALFSAIPAVSYAPTADGVEISTHPWLLLGEGKVVDVPILLGSNRDEGTMFVDLPTNASLEELNAYWSAVFSAPVVAKLSEIYLPQQYPAAEGVSQAYWAGVRSMGDTSFSCPANYASQKLLEAGRRSPTFLYFFEHARGDAAFIPHFSEVPFVFRWYYREENEPDRQVSDALSSLWGNFISSKDPNSQVFLEVPGCKTSLGRSVNAAVRAGARRSDLPQHFRILQPSRRGNRQHSAFPERTF